MGKKSRQKQRTKQEAPATTLPWQSPLAAVVFVGLCLLLFYPPYFRAMFFTKEQLPTHLFTYVLFILWLVVKYQRRDSSFLQVPLDYFAFFFALIYLLTLPMAINTRGAIQEFLKVSNYFLVYFLVWQLAATRKEATTILNVLVFSALGVAVLGLGAAAGTWQVHGGYNAGRIFSTIQYPNSLAAYLTGTFFVALGLLQSSTGHFKRLYLGVAYLLVLTVLLTYSRGGWLVMPVFALVYLLAAPRAQKKEAFLSMALVFIVASVIFLGVGRLYLAEKGALAWLTVFAGLALTLALQYLFFDLSGKTRLALYAAVLFVIVAALAAGFYVSRTLSRPLLLAHGAHEADSTKTLEERLPVRPATEYTLSMEVLAEALEDKPYAWRIIVTGQKKDGTAQPLLDHRGKDTAGWETHEVPFATPDDVDRISLRVINYYSGTSVKLRDITLSGGGSTKKINFALSRLLPATLYNRFVGFTARDSNVQARFLFTRDAWQIIKDYPVFGLGGHGWKSRYFQYQSAAYTTTEVHNHFFQVWVETGTIGFLLFLGLWVSFFHLAYKLFRATREEEKALVLAIAVAVLAVVTHSFYDFNLSLGAVCIFVFALMGTARSFYKGEKAARWQPYKNHLSLGIVMVLFIFVSSLRLGYSSFVQGTRYLRMNQPRQAAAALERATRYDRFDPEMRVALAEAYEQVGMQAQNYDYVRRAEEELKKAISLDPYQPRYSHTMGTFLVRVAQFDRGLEYLDKTIALQPYFAKHYSIYATACLNIAEYWLARNDRDQAERYLEKIFPLAGRLAQYHPESSALAYAFGQAYFRLHEAEKALDYLAAALWVADDRAKAAMLMSLIYEQKGETNRAKQYYDRALQWDPASAEHYNALKQI